MAYSTNIYTNALTGQNINTALLLGTFTNTTRQRAIRMNAFATGIVGNGNYVIYATIQRSGAGVAYEWGARTTVAVPSGVTSQAFPTLTLDVGATDVVKVYLTGLANDNTGAVNTVVDVNEQFVLTDSSGNVTFNNTSIGLTAAAVQAIWDALTAGLTTVGSIGKLLVDSIAAAILFPAGAIAFTYTVTDSVTGLPLDGVQVWFSTDAAGANVVWSGVTDAFGIARDVNLNLPRLNAGTYYVWRQLAGYVFSDPDTEVVS